MVSLGWLKKEIEWLTLLQNCLCKVSSLLIGVGTIPMLLKKVSRKIREVSHPGVVFKVPRVDVALGSALEESSSVVWPVSLVVFPMDGPSMVWFPLC